MTNTISTFYLFIYLFLFYYCCSFAVFFKSHFDEHVAACYKILGTQSVPTTPGMHVSLYVCDDSHKICFFICSRTLVYESQDRPSHCGWNKNYSIFLKLDRSRGVKPDIKIHLFSINLLVSREISRPAVSVFLSSLVFNSNHLFTNVDTLQLELNYIKSAS